MNVFMQTLNVNKVCQVWVNSRNLGFTQTWENNTKSPCAKQKRNMTPLFWVDLTFEWYEDDMVFRSLLLLLFFRTNGKKEHLIKNGFRHCYDNVFRKWHFESYLITAMFKVPSQQIRGTFTTAFWKIPYSSLFHGRGSTCVLTFSSRLW